jgi:hypothetical protein
MQDKVGLSHLWRVAVTLSFKLAESAMMCLRSHSVAAFFALALLSTADESMSWTVNCRERHERQKDRKKDRKKERQRERETERETERDRERERQRARQTESETDRERER